MPFRHIENRIDKKELVIWSLENIERQGNAIHNILIYSLTD